MEEKKLSFDELKEVIRQEAKALHDRIESTYSIEFITSSFIEALSKKGLL